MNNGLLLDFINSVGKLGIVGNEDSLLVLLNKINLRLVFDSNAFSSNLLVTGKTSSGKDFIVGELCKAILPDDFYKHYVHLTPKVFAYSDMNWNNAVLHIEDPESDLINGSVFKTVASGGNSFLVVRNQETVERFLTGKPVMLVTSVEAFVRSESIRRWDIKELDSSSGLTKRVVYVKYCQKPVVKSKVFDYLKKLKPVSIEIPFLDQLYDSFDNSLKTRTLCSKLRDYICSSALLHGRSVATWFDYEYARFCFESLNSMSGVPLNTIESEFVGILRSNGFAMSVSDINKSGFSHNISWIYDNVARLIDLGIVYSTGEFDKKANRVIRKYSSKVSGVSHLPVSYDIVKNRAFAKEFVSPLLSIDKKRVSVGLNRIFTRYLLDYGKILEVQRV